MFSGLIKPRSNWCFIVGVVVEALLFVSILQHRKIEKLSAMLEVLRAQPETVLVRMNIERVAFTDTAPARIEVPRWLPGAVPTDWRPVDLRHELPQETK
jgi:hypothetical protein